MTITKQGMEARRRWEADQVRFRIVRKDGRVHSFTSLWECAVCREKFPTKYRMKNHKITTHSI